MAVLGDEAGKRGEALYNPLHHLYAPASLTFVSPFQDFTGDMTHHKELNSSWLPVTATWRKESLSR